MNREKISAIFAWSIDTLMVIIASISSLGVLYGACLWVILYLQDPDRPYIGGSLFTMAQVVTIFGGFSFAAAFSERVNADARNMLRYVGALHLISALGFVLLGMLFPLATVNAVWSHSGGYVLQGIFLIAFCMALGGFAFGTFLWVGRIHRIASYEGASGQERDAPN